MAEMSLEELKRANAEAPEVQIPEEKPEEEQEEAQEVVEDGEEEAKADESDQPAWMQEGDKPPKERKFTDSDIGAAKAKLRAKLEKQHQAEAEALRAQIEALKRQQPQVAAKPDPRPTEEQFGYDREKYAEADAAWVRRQVTTTVAAERQAAEQAARIEAAKRQLVEAEDRHYERAGKLVSEHGISAEAYKAADAKVREALERLRPNEGDIVAAQLMSIVGDGSEKVFYYLGRNPDALAQLESAILRDPSGAHAVAFLSRKAAEITMPGKKNTTAPTPPTQINGDGAKLPSSAKALQKAYNEAHKRGDLQAAFSAKRSAKQAGVDTSTW